MALIVDRAGYLIHQHGRLEGFDPTQVATLASNAFAATEFMATLIKEPEFSGMYQQGSSVSTFTLHINPGVILFVAFRSELSAGAIKFFCADAVRRLAEQFEAAAGRDDSGGIDLSDLNAADAAPLFRRAGEPPAEAS